MPDFAQSPLTNFALEMEALLQRQCESHGVQFHLLKAELFAKWISDKEPADPAADILTRARDCLTRRDQSGYQSACLAWLQTKHGAQLGDTVRLGGWDRPRDVVIEDFLIEFEGDDLTRCSALFIGPCVSHKVKGTFPFDHLQSIKHSVLKLST